MTKLISTLVYAIIIPILLTLFLLVLVFILGDGLFNQIGSGYQNAEKTAVPKFQALNRQEFNAIPGADGFTLLKNDFDRYNHSVELRAESVVADSSIPVLYAQYDTALTTLGWQSTLQGQSSAFPPQQWALYRKGTACLSLTVISHQDQTQVSITLFHDPRKQSFSPNYPPTWLFDLYEYAETKIKECK